MPTFERHFSISAALELKLNNPRVRTGFLFGTNCKYCSVGVRCDKMSVTVTKYSDSFSHSLPVPHSWLGSSHLENKRGIPFISNGATEVFQNAEGEGDTSTTQVSTKTDAKNRLLQRHLCRMYHKSQCHCITITALLQHTPGYPSLRGFADTVCKCHSWLGTKQYKPRDCSSALWSFILCLQTAFIDQTRLPRSR